MTHELKTWAEYFIAIQIGEKSFELRKNDRNFTVGDTLILKEYVPKGWNSVSPNEIAGDYTGREITKTVCYIMKDAVQFGLLNNYVILGLK